MKTIDFYNKINLMHSKEYLESFLTYICSPIIAELKPAITLTLDKNNEKLFFSWHQFGSSFLNTVNLNYIILGTVEDSKLIIMIYDKKMLENELLKDPVREFLIGLGYPNQVDVLKYLTTLMIRYEKYHCPHELGIFLGIPIEDVKDFMNCTPKKCLLCGYWKVYNNLQQAKNTFKLYDIVKSYTIDRILKGSLLTDVALGIKTLSYTFKV